MVCKTPTVETNKVADMGISQIASKPSTSPMKSETEAPRNNTNNKSPRLDPAEIDRAFKIMKDNMMTRVEIKTEEDIKPNNDVEDEDNDGAFTKIRIKSLKEIQSDSDCSEDESEENENTASHSPRLKQAQTERSPPASIELNFGPGVFFSNSRPPHEIPRTDKPSQLCFNCKLYGHSRKGCKNKWNHWWPKEYMDRHPWLHNKVRQARQHRDKPFWFFRRLHAKLEEEAELNERDLPRKRRFLDRLSPEPTKSRVNRFETAFPKAVRRFPAKSLSNIHNSSKSERSTFPSPSDYSNALDIFDRLHRQIEELKRNLEQLKIQQEPKRLRR